MREGSSNGNLILIVTCLRNFLGFSVTPFDPTIQIERLVTANKPSRNGSAEGFFTTKDVAKHGAKESIMNALKMINDIADRGIQAIQSGKPLLPTLAPQHRTVITEEVDAGFEDLRTVNHFASSRPWRKFPYYNF
jgi:hypothetical protein